MLNKTELTILKKISENKLITKMELMAHLKKNGNNINSETLTTITRNLMEKNLVSEINPVGSTCFVITQRGTRFLEDR